MALSLPYSPFPVPRLPQVRRPGAGGVVVLVGDVEPSQFNICRELLTQHSKYFERALAGPWAESEEGILWLDEDVEVEIFDMFVDWLLDDYIEWLRGKTIDSPERVRELTRNLGKLCAGKDQLFRLKLCILADRLAADVFAHAANHCFIDHVLREQHVDYAAVIHAWKPWLPDNHPILDFLVDAQCATGKRDKDTAENGRLALREQLPHDFLLQVMDRGPVIIRDQRSLLYRCDYHDHVSEQGRKDCERRRRGKETKLEAQYWTYEPDY